MLAVVGGLVLAFALVQMASASDELYRCSDGTFTNRVERQCAPYESKGIVRVQTGHSDESKSTVKDDEPTQPFAEVQVYNGKQRVKQNSANALSWEVMSAILYRFLRSEG
jgi:hypothetical protein